jgi:hypothetical protein
LAIGRQQTAAADVHVAHDLIGRAIGTERFLDRVRIQGLSLGLGPPIQNFLFPCILVNQSFS